MISSQMYSGTDQLEICPIAQTNLQLWQQLQAAGYGDDALLIVGRAYQFAFKLFSGRFRASGKSFLAHLVGTASVLVHLKASATVIAAGLIHAAYDFGDFGGWHIFGITASKRHRLVREIGAEVESYVAGYSAMKWNPQTIPVIREQAPYFNEKDQLVLLIRLANELEEYLDLGLLYCGSKSQIYSGHQTGLVSEMAKLLGYPLLASALTSAQQAISSDRVLPGLVNPTGVSSLSLVVPYSCQRRLLPWLSSGLLGRVVRRALALRLTTEERNPSSPIISEGRAL